MPGAAERTVTIFTWIHQVQPQLESPELAQSSVWAICRGGTLLGLFAPGVLPASHL